MSVLQSTKPAPVSVPLARRDVRAAPSITLSAQDRDGAATRPRVPALGIAIAFGLGIYVDSRFLFEWRTWTIVCFLMLGTWAIAFRAKTLRLSAVCLVIACLALGGARHHLAMSTLAVDDISLFARDEPQPVHVVGTITSTPETQVVRSKGRHAGESDKLRTSWQVHCQLIDDHGTMQAVSGTVMVSLIGELADVDAGDVIEIHGRLSRPAPPANPGQFDYRDYLARHGILCTLFVDQPEAVERIARGSRLQPTRWLGALRKRCERTCDEHLSERTAPLASALLLGGRTQVSDEIRDAFASTGTTHVLAISGLNVAILAGVFWLVCRLLNLGKAKSGVTVLTLVLIYAILTGASPPVVRATVLVAILVAGQLFHRRSFHENSLAVAAIIVLCWNPADLFDVGAQLSFLAVALISWSSRFFNTSQVETPETRVANLGKSQRWKTWLGWTMKAWLVTACIWAATTPLVASMFHLVSPIGLFINVILIPVVTVVLWLGYAFLFCGLALPFLGSVVGTLFDAALSLMLWMIDAAARVGFSHVHVPGPPTWWMCGFYLLLVALLYLPGTKGHHSTAVRNCWRLLAVWVIVGLGVALLPPKRDGLRCTFLSVGHGCAVLVEFPHGRTLLYDAGSLDGDRAAQRRIEGTLWEREIATLDAIVVSHADIDHFNAVPRLIDTFRTGSLLTSRHFLDFDQLPVRDTCESAADRNVPIRLISQGQRLQFDEDVTVDVLHPRTDFHADKDNATSVVLSIEYAGRRILLTGDLEGAGLDELLQRDSMYVDVLLSPHHGSRAANPEQLAAWTHHPQIVVASSGRKHLGETLQSVYGDGSKVYSTADTGAVTVEITPQGEIRESCFLE